MNRQDFEREAALRLMTAVGANFVSAETAADYICETVKAVAERLYADPTPRLFADGGVPSELSNGDRSGITIDELRNRGEITTRTRNVLVVGNGIEYLSELSGQRERTVGSYWHVGPKMVEEINCALEKYGFSKLK